MVGVMLVAVPIAFAQEPPRNFILHQTPEPGAVVRFEDDQRQPRSLADFRGKIVLLNVWATWCAPCIKEIPALDHLAAALNGADFAVVAVCRSQGDRRGPESVHGTRRAEPSDIYRPLQRGIEDGARHRPAVT